MNRRGLLTGASLGALVMMPLSFAHAAAEQDLTCGGKAGVQCPNGYYCTDIPPDVLDATGVCKKINVEQFATCLQQRHVTVVCSTRAQCHRQRELLGDIFRYLDVRYDDDETNCEQYGRLCETEYGDVEMVAWIIPKGPPYPLEEANKYPSPTLRGTRTMEQVMWLSGCME